MRVNLLKIWNLNKLLLNVFLSFVWKEFLANCENHEIFQIWVICIYAFNDMIWIKIST